MTTQTMYDAVVGLAGNIPGDAQIVGGYDTGGPDIQWTGDTWGRFPNAVHIVISQHPGGNGNEIDVENGALSVSDIPAEVTRRVQNGHKYVSIYCNKSTWPSVTAAVTAADLAAVVVYRIADWTNPGEPANPHSIFGAWACQYAAPGNGSSGDYDMSQVDTLDWLTNAPVVTPPIPPANPSPPPPQPSGNPTYTVVSGDTLSGIAAKYGMPWQTLYNANLELIGPDPNKIYPGQVLVIPHFVAQPPRTYTVVAGDTLSGIGAKLGISWELLYNNNKAVIGGNPGLIYPGQVLTLP